MQPPNHPAGLKSQMLRAAVQENADTIADRLPVSLRPARRWLGASARQAWLLVVPVCLIAGIAVVANRSMAAVQALPVPATPVAFVPEAIVEPASAAVPDLSLLTRPLRPGALALGVRRVILDPGHGGEHLGTASGSGLLEKDMTLDLAQRARKLLVERGFEVVLTRARDDTLSLKQRATSANAKRGDRPRRSRSSTKARGSVVRTNSPIDDEIANRRTSVWAANSTPSRVASNGPISNRTVSPARVKTLTSTTEMAIGSDSSRDARTSRPRTPAADVSPSMMTMIAIGPT